MAYFVRYNPDDGTYSAKSLGHNSPNQAVGLGRTLYSALDDLELQLSSVKLVTSRAMRSRDALPIGRLKTVSHPLFLASISFAAALVTTLIFLRK